jgi:pantoate--beta-alanine ligase
VTVALAATRAELAALLAEGRTSGLPVGLVPTMGALHAGHASLMRTARRAVGAGPLVASIFVNPLQFGPHEDLDRYPRTLEADLELCAEAGVDVVFAPSVDQMYHGGPEAVTVEPGPLGTILEGATRPGHFRGVLTVVAKLLGLVRPEVAVFGEKDYQQLALIRRMADDLCLGVEVVGAETVREPDGLAMSSRNRYLDARQRQEAVVLSRALRAAQDAAGHGAAAAHAAALGELEKEPGVDVDYLAVLSPDLAGLPDVAPPGTQGRVLVAARVGTTRLIDNLPLVLGAGGLLSPER